MTTRNPIPHCDPGYHPADFIFRTNIVHYCSPDVPGNGLPMDGPTWWCLVIGAVVCVVLVIWIVHFMVVELRREKNSDEH